MDIFCKSRIAHMTKGLKFNFSICFMYSLLFSIILPLQASRRFNPILIILQQSPYHCLCGPFLHLYGKAGFIDMLQIMGIRIADNPALLQIRIIPLQLMELLQVLDLRCLKTAVRRYKAQVCRLLADLSTWAGNMTPS